MSTKQETQLRISQTALLLSQAVKDHEISAQEALVLTDAFTKLLLEVDKHE